MSESLGALLTELRSGDSARAESAANALSHFGDQAIQDLEVLLENGDADTRWWALRALAGFSQPRAGELLTKSLMDTDVSLRHCAALALSLHPHSTAIQPLVGLLGSPDSLLARLAANALVTADGEAVPALLEALEQSSTQVQAEAARALALIGDTRAIPALFKLLESDSTMVEHWASEGLAKMGVGMSFFQT